MNEWLSFNRTAYDRVTPWLDGLEIETIDDLLVKAPIISTAWNDCLNFNSLQTHEFKKASFIQGLKNKFTNLDTKKATQREIHDPLDPHNFVNKSRPIVFAKIKTLKEQEEENQPK